MHGTMPPNRTDPIVIAAAVKTTPIDAAPSYIVVRLVACRGRRLMPVLGPLLLGLLRALGAVFDVQLGPPRAGVAVPRRWDPYDRSAN